MDDWQVRVVGEDRVVVLRAVDRIWVADLARAGFTRRTADVGGPALCEVAAMTVVEARRFNAAFLEEAQAEVKAEQKELDQMTGDAFAEDPLCAYVPAARMPLGA